MSGKFSRNSSVNRRKYKEENEAKCRFEVFISGVPGCMSGYPICFLARTPEEAVSKAILNIPKRVRNPFPCNKVIEIIVRGMV